MVYGPYSHGGFTPVSFVNRKFSVPEGWTGICLFRSLPVF